MPSYYTGWKLATFEQSRLLAMFTPAYPDVIAHHMTYQFGVSEDSPLPSGDRATVVGVTDDGAGVQALVLEVNGTQTRPDGKTYHITWSLDRSKGAKPFHSVRVIEQNGFTPCPPIPVRLVPQRFET